MYHPIHVTLRRPTIYSYPEIPSKIPETTPTTSRFAIEMVHDIFQFTLHNIHDRRRRRRSVGKMYNPFSK